MKHRLHLRPKLRPQVASAQAGAAAKPPSWLRALGQEAFASQAKGCHLIVDLFPGSQWKTDDRDWFAANPKRSHRLRRMFAGEWPPGTGDGMTHVLIKQLEPGMRVRVLATSPDHGAVLDECPDHEGLIAELWRRIDAGVEFNLCDVLREVIATESLTRGVGLQ